MGSLPKQSGTSSLRNLLSWKEVDAVYREPFVVNGYRRPHTSFYQCLQYAFILHNDVGNFWTHFIPLLAWLLWFYYHLSASSISLLQPYHYPLVCFWAGACSYALCSSIAHLFSNKSFEVRTICFMLDYLGIAMYGLGSNITALFYLSPCSSPCFAYKPLILFFEVSVSIMATLLSALTRFFWGDYRFVIRVSAYAVPYMCGVAPFIHRVIVCWLYGTDCVPETMFLHILGVVLTILLTFFFVTKIPERLAPGRFDMFFQSHQIFHVLSACFTSLQMYFLPLEMQLRQDALSRVEGAVPSWETTFFPFLCAELGGLAVVAGLGILTYSGILTTNKRHGKQE